ncbi:protein transport protein gos1 [Saitoella coloradoensis]
MASSSSSWPSLRSKARSLESQTESFFLQYSALAQSSGQTSDDEALESKLTTILQERQEVINTLSRLLDMDTAANSTTKVHQLQRHREILAEHNKEFHRIKDNIEQTRNHSDLLSSVRRDIKQYKDATGLADAEAGYMLQERGRIDNSHRMADSVLAQAYETREEFARQKAALKRIQSRITETAMQIPGLNTLISKINTRRKRDSLIIALLISFCVFGLFMLR